MVGIFLLVPINLFLICCLTCSKSTDGSWIKTLLHYRHSICWQSFRAIMCILVIWWTFFNWIIKFWPLLLPLVMRKRKTSTSLCHLPNVTSVNLFIIYSFRCIEINLNDLVLLHVYLFLWLIALFCHAVLAKLWGGASTLSLRALTLRVLLGTRSMRGHFGTRSVYIDSLSILSSVLHHQSILQLCRIRPTSLSVAYTNLIMEELLLVNGVSCILLFLYLHSFNAGMHWRVNASSCLNCLPWCRLEHKCWCICLAGRSEWCVQ